MYSIEPLSLRGFRGKTVHSTLFRQESETGHVAIVFPGYGYRCSGPVVYYPSFVLLSLGADVLWVEYAYDKEPEYRTIRPEERREWRLADAREAVRVALDRRTYGQVTLVAKSLGTLVLGDLLSEESSCVPQRQSG